MSAVGSSSRASVIVNRSPSEYQSPPRIAAASVAMPRFLANVRPLITRPGRKPSSREVVCATSRSTISGLASRAGDPSRRRPRAKSITVSSRLCIPPSARSISTATVSSDGRRRAGTNRKAAAAAATQAHQPANTAIRPATGSGAARSSTIPPTTQPAATATARNRPAATAVATSPARVRDTTRSSVRVRSEMVTLLMSVLEEGADVYSRMRRGGWAE